MGRQGTAAGRGALGQVLGAMLTACPASGVNVVKPSATGAPAIGVSAFSVLAGGSAGFADGKGTAARFREPNGVDVGAAGNLYVADTKNHRIRAIALQHRTGLKS